MKTSCTRETTPITRPRSSTTRSSGFSANKSRALLKSLTLHRRGLEALTRALLERETIDGAEAARLIDEANGEPVHPAGTKTVSALSGVGKKTPAKEATPVAPAATSPATPPAPATPNWQPPTLPAV